MRPAIKKKADQVKELLEEMKNYKTVVLLNLQKLPDALLQNLRKKIKENGGKVKVLRKAVITRLLQSNPVLASQVDNCDKPLALVLTNQSPYEVYSFLRTNKKKRAAKVGDVPKEDIVVPAGETDLPPGPALSELKAAGIAVQIKGGKIHVIKDSVVAKAGEEIKEKQVKALQTLGIMPFEVMATMLFGFDGNYVYSMDVLSIGDTIQEDLQQAFSQSFNLSVNAGYPTTQNIELLLQTALQQSLNMAINGNLYSRASISHLLSKALREASALEKRGV